MSGTIVLDLPQRTGDIAQDIDIIYKYLLALQSAQALGMPSGWSSSTGSRHTIATGATLAQTIDALGTLIQSLLTNNVLST